MGQIEGESERERAHWVAVTETPGIGPVLFKKLLAGFGTAEAIWEADKSVFVAAGGGERVWEGLVAQRKKRIPTTHLRSLADLGIQVICLFDREYPAGLKTIHRPPPVLYVRGSLVPADERAVAVVGTRMPTLYGKQVTEQFVAELVAAGLTIVSGLAFGIDKVAHETALVCGGRTIGFLGGGPDHIHPVSHRALAEKIMAHGAVVSEYPPGLVPSKGIFPARNRLIAGMSLGVLVVEGMSHSGTKSTAEHAFAMGRPVLAVPGPITSRLSDAPNELLGRGALVVRSAADVLEQLRISSKDGEVEPKQVLTFASKAEETVYSLLEGGAIELDALIRQSQLPAQVILSAISLLELRGVIKDMGSRHYVRIY